MPDLVTGICVLVCMEEPNDFLLFLTETKEDGSVYHSHIPVIDAHLPAPAEKIGPRWNFIRSGKMLQVQPSVHNLSTGFHNSGNWSVEFVEVNSDAKGGYDGYAIHKELREKGQQSQEYIRELIDQGILLP